MMLSPDDLQDKSIEDLRAIVTDYHASWHHREKKETLIERICELSVIIQPDQKNKRTTEQPQKIEKPAPNMLTDEEILEALTEQIERGLLVRVDDVSWSIRFRDKTDTGSLTMPLRTIIRCADTIMRSSSRMPKCVLCGSVTEYREGLGYVCINPACKRQVKPANPPVGKS